MYPINILNILFKVSMGDFWIFAFHYASFEANLINLKYAFGNSAYGVVVYELCRLVVMETQRFFCVV